MSTFRGNSFLAITINMETTLANKLYFRRYIWNKIGYAQQKHLATKAGQESLANQRCILGDITLLT